MYIEKIQSPADLKKLDITALNVVADEVRSAVLRRVSMHGGHVGPNLGFVEATVALHYVFDAPKDKLVFDVSHQCYPHKVLTGRAAGFMGDTDAMNAISGYSSPNESPIYDNFEVGHTSTSISLATGLQKARDIHGSDENIIAIIGDGSLSGGEAFEGLDEASELGTGIIIVVNDNEMSIAENHGGIYKNLRALRESGGRCAHNWFKLLCQTVRYSAKPLCPLPRAQNRVLSRCGYALPSVGWYLSRCEIHLPILLRCYPLPNIHTQIPTP